MFAALIKLPIAGLLLWIPFRRDEAMTSTDASTDSSEEDGGSKALPGGPLDPHPRRPCPAARARGPHGAPSPPPPRACAPMHFARAARALDLRRPAGPADRRRSPGVSGCACAAGARPSLWRAGCAAWRLSRPLRASNASGSLAGRDAPGVAHDHVADATEQHDRGASRDQDQRLRVGRVRRRARVRAAGRRAS